MVNTLPRQIECSGVRDPAGYVKRRDLASAAAFDRDFNFLAGVERAFERAERLRQQRGLPDLHARTTQSAPTTSADGGGGAGAAGSGSGRGAAEDGAARKMQRLKGKAQSAAEALLQKRFAEVGVEVVRAPLGLTRQKQNLTHWHSK
ncbi:hypothetical protein KEM52_002903 [Ascosphaera acerosa]|nr:hypothetical protein KEM52_002903 [Ascosphaera acerosa]